MDWKYNCGMTATAAQKGTQRLKRTRGARSPACQYRPAMVRCCEKRGCTHQDQECAAHPQRPAQDRKLQVLIAGRRGPRGKPESRLVDAEVGELRGQTADAHDQAVLPHARVSQATDDEDGGNEGGGHADQLGHNGDGHVFGRPPRAQEGLNGPSLRRGEATGPSASDASYEARFRCTLPRRRAQWDWRTGAPQFARPRRG